MTRDSKVGSLAPIRGSIRTRADSQLKLRREAIEVLHAG